jgi:uncharacterized protein (UPF0305 family)
MFYPKPQHYPKWLRVLIFDPMERLKSIYTSDPERNCKTLEKIYHGSYKSNEIHALLFDAIIEMGRKEVNNHEFRKVLQRDIEDIRNRLERLEREYGVRDD